MTVNLGHKEPLSGSSPRNDLNLLAEWRNLMLPIHHHTGSTERSSQMHLGVLVADTLHGFSVAP